MKTILRNSSTRLYIASKGGWTSDVRRAARFESLGAAVKFAREDGLKEMAVVLANGSGVFLTQSLNHSGSQR